MTIEQELIDAMDNLSLTVSQFEIFFHESLSFFIGALVALTFVLAIKITSRF